MAEQGLPTSSIPDQQAFIAELSQFALTTPSLEALFDKTVRQIKGILKADFCEVLEYTPQTQTFLLRAGAGWKKELVRKAQLEAGKEWEPGYTMSRERPVIVDDLSLEKHYQAPALLAEQGVKSGISVIIKGTGQPYGVLSVHSRNRGFFNSADVLFIKTAANLLAGSLQRSTIETELRNLHTSLEAQVEERTRLLRFLQDVTVMAHETSSITDAMSIFLDMVRTITGWQIGHVLLITGQEPGAVQSIWSLERKRSAGKIQQARDNLHLEQEDSLAGAAWKKGEPVLLEDISYHEIAGNEALVGAGLKAALAIPVFTGKQVAAVLEFFFENANSVTSYLLEALVNASLELSRVIERRRSRERLRESQLQTIEAQHIARLGSWEWDIAANKVSWSHELSRIFDLAEGELEGTFQAFLTKFHPEDVERAQIEFMRAYEHGVPFNFQHRIVRSNGEQRVLQTRGRAVHNKQRQPVRIIGTAQDITEMAAIENRMQVQDELLENVLAQSQIILWSIDRQGELRLSRRGGLAALGILSGDQAGANILKTLPQDHPLIGYINHALEGRSVHVDFKVDERIYDLRILPQVDAQENVVGVNGIAFDITQRVEMEQALRKSEQTHRLIVDNVQDYAIFSLDRDGTITSWNVGAKRVVGYQASEIIGSHYSTFFTPEDRELRLPQRALEIALKQGKFEAEGWRIRKDGSKFWTNSLLTPYKDEKGELLGFTKLVRDYTSRREAEQALQESEKRFRSIFEFGALGIALLDLNGNFILTNPSLQKMLFFEAQELLSNSLKSLSYPYDAISLMEMFTETANGINNFFRQESRFQRKDRQIVWVSLTFSLVRDANETPAFVIGLFEDVTYRKKMEAELREIKRQLIISEEQQRYYLAKELHDDPMQELYGVLFQLETMDGGMPQEADAQKELQAQLKLTTGSIEKVIQKLRVICGQLRPINLAPFGLEGAIREHMDRFREEHPNLDVTLELSYDGQLLSEEVRISLFRIYQQAMGNIIRHAQANHVTVRFYYDHQNASLEVEDDGVGFDVPSNLLRLARQDHLGIAGAAERAGLLGGKLTIRSIPGKGTLLLAVIPLKPFEDPAIGEINRTAATRLR